VLAWEYLIAGGLRLLLALCLIADVFESQWTHIVANFSVTEPAQTLIDIIILLLEFPLLKCIACHPEVVGESLAVSALLLLAPPVEAGEPILEVVVD
jgi:hypothetical protein